MYTFFLLLQNLIFKQKQANTIQLEKWVFSLFVIGIIGIMH